MKAVREPVFNGVKPKLSKEAKYLDNKLSWKKNIEERMRRGLNACYTNRNVIGKTSSCILVIDICCKTCYHLWVYSLVEST